jgi:hypothetical protein
MKQIFSARINHSLQNLEETSLLAEKSFRTNNIDIIDFYPMIHLVNEIIGNTIISPLIRQKNKYFEIRIYLNSVITCIIEADELELASHEFTIENGSISSSFYENKIDKINYKHTERGSTLILQSKHLSYFKTFNN